MGRCVFADKWLKDDKFSSWVAPHATSRQKARCKVCNKDIDVSTMGESALVSHMAGKKHKEAVARRQSIPVTAFLTRSGGSIESNSLMPSSSQATASAPHAQPSHATSSASEPSSQTTSSSARQSSLAPMLRAMMFSRQRFTGR